VEGHEHCDQCGFDGSAYSDDDLLSALRELGPRWRALLAPAGANLRTRPAPGVWSAIEYAAHSRDVTALHAFGVEQALTIDEPVLPGISDDLVDRAAENYATEDLDTVVEALDTHARRLATLAADAGTDAWTRGLTIGDDRTEVRRLLEHALHDSTHHLDDVEQGFSRLVPKPPPRA
jgi:hypothetical protein